MVMRIQCLVIWILAPCAALAVVSGCGGVQPLSEPSNAVSQSATTALRSDHKYSRMLSAEKSSALLYVASGGNQSVYVYSYPQGELVSMLTGFSDPSSLCSDTHGDIFVTDFSNQNIVEYAHGGTSPIATLNDSGYGPYACSFDPTTGNLAVANYSTYGGGSSTGNIAMYANAQGEPTDYADSAMWRYFNCGYDNKGDLFLDGLDDTQHSVFAELPEGNGTFTNLSVPFYNPGPIQWDGQALAVATTPGMGDSKIYRLQVSGSEVTVEGSTSIKWGKHKVSVNGFWIGGHRVVGTLNSGHTGFWRYPTGGRLTKRLPYYSDARGVTVSFPNQ
jgi:hypothetical protein